MTFGEAYAKLNSFRHLRNDKDTGMPVQYAEDLISTAKSQLLKLHGNFPELYIYGWSGTIVIYARLALGLCEKGSERDIFIRPDGRFELDDRPLNGQPMKISGVWK